MKKSFEGYLVVGLGLLIGGAACEVLPLEEAPASAGDVSVESADFGVIEQPLSSELADDGDELRCVCIAFPCTTCAEGSLFCNDQGDCFCDASVPPQSSPLLLARRRDCWPLATDLAGSVGALARSVRASERDSKSAGDSERTLDRPDCLCAGGTASNVSAGCPEENWYCNPSGVCRCHW